MTDHMTPEEKFAKCFAGLRETKALGMAAAHKWKHEHHECQRCGGEGLIRTWGGRAGEGGRVGPCPRCNVIAAARFAQQLAHELFGEGRLFASQMQERQR